MLAETPTQVEGGFIILGLAGRSALGLVFLVSGTSKLRSPRTAAQLVVNYRILPDRMAVGFAILLIPAELLLSASFLTGWAQNYSLPTAALLLTAFVTAVGTNLRRGRRIPCGCLGANNRPISPRTLGQLALMILAVILVSSLQLALVPLPTADTVILSPLGPWYAIQITLIMAFGLVASLWIASIFPDAAVEAHTSRPG